MYCSGCGQAVAPEQPFCPQCGRQIAPPVPPVPGLSYLLENYASKVKTLGIFWIIYGVGGFLLSVAALTFAKALFSGGFGPWMHGPWAHGPMPPFFLAPAFMNLIWFFLVVRSALALVAGWGLLQHAPWGRLVAIVAAIFNLLKIPFGTAMGIWTLIVLLGYRNNALYDQL